MKNLLKGILGVLAKVCKATMFMSEILWHTGFKFIPRKHNKNVKNYRTYKDIYKKYYKPEVKEEPKPVKEDELEQEVKKDIKIESKSKQAMNKLDSISYAKLKAGEIKKVSNVNNLKRMEI